MAASTAIFKKFGIKEVADVAFYTVGDVKVDENGAVTFVGTGDRTGPVLTFDTLKVSNFEFTGETAEARGGKGNTVLISWDHSREGTLTIEDALLSVESLNAMLSSEKTAQGDADTAIITVSANGFPGTYTVVGKTYARDVDGTDHLLTFVIWRAKVQAEASFEMSADGDPSTLNMTLKVLRADTDATIGSTAGEMVKFIVDKSAPGTVTPSFSFPRKGGN
jgi:hypothetical protein